jgi:hypothetical protein
MTTGEAPVLPLFLCRFVLLPEARHVRHDDIHGALALEPIVAVRKSRLSFLAGPPKMASLNGGRRKHFKRHPAPFFNTVIFPPGLTMSSF